MKHTLTLVGVTLACTTYCMQAQTYTTWTEQGKQLEQILATLVNNEPNVSLNKWLRATERQLKDIYNFRALNNSTKLLYQEKLAPMIKRLMNNISSAIYLQAQALPKTRNKVRELSPEIKQACTDFKRLFGSQPAYNEYYEKFLKPLGV